MGILVRSPARIFCQISTLIFQNMSIVLLNPSAFYQNDILFREEMYSHNVPRHRNQNPIFFFNSPRNIMYFNQVIDLFDF